jgi:hypothetical protein
MILESAAKDYEYEFLCSYFANDQSFFVDFNSPPTMLGAFLRRYFSAAADNRRSIARSKKAAMPDVGKGPL